MPIITMVIDSASSALSEFISLAGDAFTFIMGNWALATVIIVPIAGMIIAFVISLVRGR